MLLSDRFVSASELGVTDHAFKFNFELVIVEHRDCCPFFRALTHLLVLKNAFSLPRLSNLVLPIGNLIHERCEAGPLVSFRLACGHSLGPRLGVPGLVPLHHFHLIFKRLRQLFK